MSESDSYYMSLVVSQFLLKEEKWKENGGGVEQKFV